MAEQTAIALSGYIGTAPADNEENATIQVVANDKIDLADGQSNMIDILDPKEQMLDEEKSRANNLSGCATIAISLRYLLGLVSKASFIEITKRSTYQVYIHRPQLRLLHVAVSSVLVVFFANSTRLGIALDTAISVFFSLLAVFIFLSVAVLRVSVTAKRSVLEVFNTALGIPCHDNGDSSSNSVDVLFDVDRQYWGALYVVVTIFALLNELVVWTAFRMTEGETSECYSDEPSFSNASTRGKCAVGRASISQIYVLVLALYILGASYYRVDPVFVARMNKFFNAKGGDGLTDKVRMLRNRAQKKLRVDWKVEKELSNRGTEVALSFVCAFAFHVFVFGVLLNDIVTAETSTSADMYGWYLLFSDAVMLTCCIFIVFEMFLHYRFPTFILSSMFGQFNADNVDDIIAWWQLREYYVKCIIDVYATGITAIVACGLFGFLLLALFGLTWTDDDEERAEMVAAIFIVFAFVLLGFTLSLTRLAVNVYTIQLDHKHTIKREMLRLCHFLKCGTIETVDRILEDIETNSQPFRVFGVKIVPEFFFALQTTGFTVFLAYFLG